MDLSNCSSFDPSDAWERIQLWNSHRVQQLIKQYGKSSHWIDHTCALQKAYSLHASSLTKRIRTLEQECGDISRRTSGKRAQNDNNQLKSRGEEDMIECKSSNSGLEEKYDLLLRQLSLRGEELDDLEKENRLLRGQINKKGGMSIVPLRKNNRDVFVQTRRYPLQMSTGKQTEDKVVLLKSEREMKAKYEREMKAKYEREMKAKYEREMKAKYEREMEILSKRPIVGEKDVQTVEIQTKNVSSQCKSINFKSVEKKKDVSSQCEGSKSATISTQTIREVDDPNTKSVECSCGDDSILVERKDNDSFQQDCLSFVSNGTQTTAKVTVVDDSRLRSVECACGDGNIKSREDDFSEVFCQTDCVQTEISSSQTDSVSSSNKRTEKKTSEICVQCSFPSVVTSKLQEKLRKLEKEHKTQQESSLHSEEDRKRRRDEFRSLVRLQRTRNVDITALGKLCLYKWKGETDCTKLRHSISEMETSLNKSREELNTSVKDVEDCKTIVEEQHEKYNRFLEKTFILRLPVLADILLNYWRLKTAYSRQNKLLTEVNEELRKKEEDIREESREKSSVQKTKIHAERQSQTSVAKSRLHLIFRKWRIYALTERKISLSKEINSLSLEKENDNQTLETLNSKLSAMTRSRDNCIRMCIRSESKFRVKNMFSVWRGVTRQGKVSSANLTNIKMFVNRMSHRRERRYLIQCISRWKDNSRRIAEIRRKFSSMAIGIQRSKKFQRRRICANLVQRSKISQERTKPRLYFYKWLSVVLSKKNSELKQMEEVVQDEKCSVEKKAVLTESMISNLKSELSSVRKENCILKDVLKKEQHEKIQCEEKNSELSSSLVNAQAEGILVDSLKEKISNEEARIKEMIEVESKNRCKQLQKTSEFETSCRELRIELAQEKAVSLLLSTRNDELEKYVEEYESRSSEKVSPISRERGVNTESKVCHMKTVMCQTMKLSGMHSMSTQTPVLRVSSSSIQATSCTQMKNVGLLAQQSHISVSCQTLVERKGRNCSTQTAVVKRKDLCIQTVSEKKPQEQKKRNMEKGVQIVMKTEKRNKDCQTVVKQRRDSVSQTDEVSVSRESLDTQTDSYECESLTTQTEDRNLGCDELVQTIVPFNDNKVETVEKEVTAKIADFSEMLSIGVQTEDDGTERRKREIALSGSVCLTHISSVVPINTRDYCCQVEPVRVDRTISPIERVGTLRKMTTQISVQTETRKMEEISVETEGYGGVGVESVRSGITYEEERIMHEVTKSLTQSTTNKFQDVCNDLSDGMKREVVEMKEVGERTMSRTASCMSKREVLLKGVEKRISTRNYDVRPVKSSILSPESVRQIVEECHRREPLEESVENDGNLNTQKSLVGVPGHSSYSDKELVNMAMHDWKTINSKPRSKHLQVKNVPTLRVLFPKRRKK